MNANLVGAIVGVVAFIALLFGFHRVHEKIEAPKVVVVAPKIEAPKPAPKVIPKEEPAPKAKPLPTRGTPATAPPAKKAPAKKLAPKKAGVYGGTLSCSYVPAVAYSSPLWAVMAAARARGLSPAQLVALQGCITNHKS